MSVTNFLMLELNRTDATIDLCRVVKRAEEEKKERGRSDVLGR